MKKSMQRCFGVMILGVAVVASLRGAFSADEAPRPAGVSGEVKRTGLFAKMEVGQYAYLREGFGRLIISYADVELPAFGPRSQVIEVGSDYVVLEEQAGEDIVERRIPMQSILFVDKIRKK